MTKKEHYAISGLWWAARRRCSALAKAVLISIRPKWCEKIASGEKTIDVRKARPKLQTPFKCYVYRTKGTVPHIINGKWVQMEVGGTVVGEFICDRIYELETRSPGGSYYVKGEGQPTTNDVARQSCLSLRDMHEYLKSKVGYGWHISGLKIYDTPKELRKFSRPFENCIDKVCDEFGCALCENVGHIKRPPQSWCYVDVL